MRVEGGCNVVEEWLLFVFGDFGGEILFLFFLMGYFLVKEFVFEVLIFFFGIWKDFVCFRGDIMFVDLGLCVFLLNG